MLRSSRHAQTSILQVGTGDCLSQADAGRFARAGRLGGAAFAAARLVSCGFSAGGVGSLSSGSFGEDLSDEGWGGEGLELEAGSRGSRCASQGLFGPLCVFVSRGSLERFSANSAGESEFAKDLNRALAATDGSTESPVKLTITGFRGGATLPSNADILAALDQPVADKISAARVEMTFVDEAGEDKVKRYLVLSGPDGKDPSGKLQYFSKNALVLRECTDEECVGDDGGKACGGTIGDDDDDDDSDLDLESIGKDE